MKKRILALALFGLLLLPGCTSMLERSYVSSAAHVDYSVTEEASILRVETYQDLVNSILHFVNERADSGTIRLYNYTGDVEADLANACNELLHRDPLCAYSLRSVNYDSTRILTYYEVDLTFDYARTAEEVASIREIAGTSRLRQELAQMVTGQETTRTFLISYFSGTAEMVEQLLMQSYFNDPVRYHDPGGTFSCDISLYPETGTRRIVEVTVNRWGTATKAELTEYAHLLETASAQALLENPPEGDAYTVEELVNIVRAVSGPYDFHGTHLPLGVLSGESAYDTGLLLAMKYLCQQADIDAISVLGDGKLWLIVSTPDGFRHLLPQALYPSTYIDSDGNVSEAPEEHNLTLYSDEDLLALGGYTWDTTLYPACIATAPLPEE